MVAKKKESAKKSVEKKAKPEAKEAISKDMLIGEVVQKYPETVEVMFKHGMHCIGCGMTAYESIEQGCMGHGLDEKDVDKMVSEMNQLLKKKAKQ